MEPERPQLSKQEILQRLVEIEKTVRELAEDLSASSLIDDDSRIDKDNEQRHCGAGSKD